MNTLNGLTYKVSCKLVADCWMRKILYDLLFMSLMFKKCLLLVKSAR